MEARLDSAFKSAVECKKVPALGAIIFDRNGTISFKGTYGTINVDDASAPSFDADTPAALWSCTKLFTSVAALQLLEQGKLSLDDPVEKYVPGIAKLQVLEAVRDGKPELRDAKTKPTILHLFTHTTGFTYDFSDQLTADWKTATGQGLSEYSGVGSMQTFEQPFIFDPGTRHCYGISIDWLGFVVEAISGLPLNDYVEKNILQPLGMKNTGSHLGAGQEKLSVHIRDVSSGKLTAVPALAYADKPEKYGGGHYLYSTLNDWSAFLITILNNGAHPKSNVRILKESTVKDYVLTDQLPKVCSGEGVGVMRTANPGLTLEGELLPGLEKGWSCGLMTNKTESGKGRGKASGAWAGLGNLFYWLDPVHGKGGLIMSEILPFMDSEVLHLFDELERAAYGHDAAGSHGEAGSNFSTISAAA